MPIKYSICTDGLNGVGSERPVLYKEKGKHHQTFISVEFYWHSVKRENINMAPAINTSVFIRKPPLEQNQTHTGMESDVLETARSNLHEIIKKRALQSCGVSGQGLFSVLNLS